MMKILLREHKLDTVLLNVTVNQGKARLWVVVDNAEQAAVAEAAVKFLPGVKFVENNLSPEPMSGVSVWV